MLKKFLPKAIAVVGPTAAGKTKLGVALAKQFNGEIVSADSRQVYKYLDIATGKDKNEYVCSYENSHTSPLNRTVQGYSSLEENEIQSPLERGGRRHRRGTGCVTSRKITIPYHLIDILEPSEEITVADFQKKAFVTINKILKRKKLPVVVGGSPFYIYAITEGWQFPKVEKDEKLRGQLNKLSLLELQNILRKIDPAAFEKIDQKNPRRLIRAIEVCKLSGQDFERSMPTVKPKYNFLFLGIKFSNEELKKRIKKRLAERLDEGMIEEIKNIVAKKLASYADLERMGLEPRFIAYYLQKKINKEQLKDLLLKNIYHFAKRQMTWFRKDKKIKWVKNINETVEYAEGFLK